MYKEETIQKKSTLKGTIQNLSKMLQNPVSFSSVRTRNWMDKI